jgi:hypothetical protein
VALYYVSIVVIIIINAYLRLSMLTGIVSYVLAFSHLISFFAFVEHNVILLL